MCLRTVTAMYSYKSEISTILMEYFLWNIRLWRSSNIYSWKMRLTCTPGSCSQSIEISVKSYSVYCIVLLQTIFVLLHLLSSNHNQFIDQLIKFLSAKSYENENPRVSEKKSQESHWIEYKFLSYESLLHRSSYTATESFKLFEMQWTQLTEYIQYHWN